MRLVFRRARGAKGLLVAAVGAAFNGQRVLIIAHSANKWALDCLLSGATLEHLIDAPFHWQEGWHYTLPTPWP
jgi:alpha-ribazole phosphatase/probable phosphoglycerate mutase